MTMIILLLALNFGISWWNCYACGRAWEETKAVGGFPRLLVWCGAIQSAVGFSSVLLFFLGWIAYSVGKLPPSLLHEGLSLWYVLVILPCVSTGFIITIESWNEWWRDRSLTNLGVASYNTFAQIHNTMSMVNDFGDAFKDAGKLFDGISDSDDPKGALALLVIVGVLIALAGGIILTMVLIKKYSGTIPVPTRAQAW